MFINNNTTIVDLIHIITGPGTVDDHLGPIKKLLLDFHRSNLMPCSQQSCLLPSQEGLSLLLRIISLTWLLK